MKTEFDLYLWLTVMISLIMREKSFNKYKQSEDFMNNTIPKGYNLYNINSTFISPIYTFPWRET